jgi:hypothetical protein
MFLPDVETVRLCEAKGMGAVKGAILLGWQAVGSCTALYMCLFVSSFVEMISRRILSAGHDPPPVFTELWRL